MPYTLCTPKLKHHQCKHHQQHKSLNINSILTSCSDDHPVVRHVSTCESHIHKSNTTRPYDPTVMTHTLCKPTLKHHQYKHHEQHKSININPILTRYRDDHPAIVTSAHAKATYTNQIQPDQSEKNHHAIYSDDHPAVRHAITCKSHIHKSNTRQSTKASQPSWHIHTANQHFRIRIHKSNTSQPKRANHHYTYTLQTNVQTPSI